MKSPLFVQRAFLASWLLALSPLAHGVNNETWHTLDLELSGQELRLGPAAGFDFHNASFEVELHLMRDGTSQETNMSAAYLIEGGLVDHAQPAELTSSEPLETPHRFTFKQRISGADDARLEVTHIIESVDLSNKPLGQHAMLIGAALQMQQPQHTPTFGPGSRCLVQTEKSLDQPAFYFSRQRSSPFKSVEDYLAHRKHDLGRKLVSAHTGQWAGTSWARVQALNYKNAPYFLGAVAWAEKIYLASYYPKGSNANPLKECIAYNQAAIDAVQSHFKH